MTHDQFMRVFDAWAPTYDQTVYSPGAEGFEHYGQVLAAVAAAAAVPPGGLVVDVGAGTGNLSAALQRAGHRVTAVEPSAGMRAEARRKLPGVPILDGHFLDIPLPDRTADAVVSTYALHHLDDAAKQAAAREIARVLRPGGKVAIGDIAFAGAAERDRFRQELLAAGKTNLVAEFDAEYYTTADVLADAFRRAGFRAGARQVDRWVWLLAGERLPAR